MHRKGQLFLIEVVIAVSVLIVLISALFSIQSFTPPPSEESLRANGKAAIDVLVESNLMFDYLSMANYSRYILGDTIFDSQNQTKIDIENTIDGVLPTIANFKAFTERFNDTTGRWEQLDVLNIEQTVPAGSNTVVVDYYCPGFNGIFAQFTFQLFLWYEVSS